VRKRCVFKKYDLPCNLGTEMGKNPNGVCHNNSANTFPRAVLNDKDGAAGGKGDGVW
jgi:hypothetical protein